MTASASEGIPHPERRWESAAGEQRNGALRIELSESHEYSDLRMAATECVLLSELGREQAAQELLDERSQLHGLVNSAQVPFRLRNEAPRGHEAARSLPSALPATARFLELHTPTLGEAAQQASERLERRIASWLEQRLWADNRARELVIHDERHSERVDSLCRRLFAPLLFESASPLRVVDVEALSAAAWLHDWGHEGGAVDGALVGRAEPLVVTEAEGTRRLHGIISRELLNPDWQGRHGLEPEMASLVGILSAHHQGWTSCGNRRAEDAVETTDGRLDVRPPSLREDVEKHNETFSERKNLTHPRLQRLDYERVQLLVALLRVADACDVGHHRVPDAGQAKETYLARSVQVRCRRTETALRAMDGDYQGRARDAVAAVRSVLREARNVCLTGLEPAGRGGRLAKRMKECLEGYTDLPPVARLDAYIDFAASQAEFYEGHGRVGNVWFRVEPVDERRSAIRHRVTVCVTPASSESGDAHADCREVVHKDLKKELTREQGVVAETLLRRAGIRFEAVENTETGDREDVKAEDGDVDLPG